MTPSFSEPLLNQFNRDSSDLVQLQNVQLRQQSRYFDGLWIPLQPLPVPIEMTIIASRNDLAMKRHHPQVKS